MHLENFETVSLNTCRLLDINSLASILGCMIWVYGTAKFKKLPLFYNEKQEEYDIIQKYEIMKLPTGNSLAVLTTSPTKA